MDDLDRKLIGRLRADSRESIAGLAAQLKVSRGTVQNRIDRMVAQGDILGFTIATRPDVEDQKIRAIMSIAIEGERIAAVGARLRAPRSLISVAPRCCRDSSTCIRISAANTACTGRTSS